MANLTLEEQQFYDRLFPCLRDRRWQYTGTTAYGNIAWLIELPEIQYEEISAIPRIGLALAPNSAHFSLRVSTSDYPQKTYWERLTIDPNSKNATSDRIQQLCQQTAIDLLKENATEIRQIRQQWLDEVARMKKWRAIGYENILHRSRSKHCNAR